MLMNKIILWGIALSLVFTPNFVWASPGPVDQYGGHVCLQDCSLYGLTWNEYHYHDLANPGFLSGEYQKPNYSYLFYLPTVVPINLTVKETVVKDSGLVENSNLDKDYCAGETVYSHGLYDSQNRVRIKPVCVGDEGGIKAKTELTLDSFYADLPNSEINNVNRIYHISLQTDGKKVFTDRPELAELKGKLIQGITDKTLYYVYPFSSDLVIRPISEQKAVFYLGGNYSSQILYFTDSIIYTYKIGEPIM